MIFPFKLDIHIYRQPVTNLLLIVLMTAAFVLSFFPQYFQYLEILVLEDWDPVQLSGNVFLHADIYKLVWNVLFLFVFGNAVCSVIGNLFYPLFFIIFAAAGSAVHLYMDGFAVVGAGSVVSGMIGILVVWFPKSKVKFYYFFWFISKTIHGSFRIKMIFVAVVYFTVDMFLLNQYGPGIPYFTYAGGFAVGFLTALFSQFLHIWHLGDDTLIDLITGNKNKPLVSDISELGIVNDENTYLEEDDMGTLEDGQTDLIEEIVGEDDEINDAIEVNIPLPDFRVLRIQEDTGYIKCFIVNEGDTIINTVISSPDLISCEIEPANKFRSGDAGIIKFRKPEKYKTELHFELSYEYNGEELRNLIIFNLPAEQIKIK